MRSHAHSIKNPAKAKRGAFEITETLFSNHGSVYEYMAEQAGR
jgi:hypothetical protein